MDPTRPKYSKIKDISDITGHSGPWQMRTVTIFLFIAFSCSWHNLILTFQAPNVKHWCRQSQNITRFLASKNYQCYDGEQKCKSWTYDNTIFHKTIVNEWDLVCDREWITSLAKSIYMLGHLVASLVFGQLSDRMGRRPIILFCYLLFWVSAVATVFADSVITFLVLRFLVSLGMSAAFTTAFVTVMEVMGSELRPIYGVACKFGWTLGYMILPAIAWFVRDWRQLQVAITLPWVTMAAMWWFLEESPRWLLIAGKEEMAEAILLKACKQNGKILEDVQVPLKKLCSRSLKEKVACSKEDILDLLKYPSVRSSTFYLFFIWFSTALVYYAITWGTNDLEGDPFWNFFLSGLVEIPSKLIAIFVVGNCGRRTAVAYASFLGGSILIFYSCMVAWQDIGHKVFCFMIAKLCITITFTLLYIYSSELFPTTVRGLGIGYCSTAARVGAILAPFMTHIDSDRLPHLSYWTYGLLSVSCGFCTLLLPETSKRKLPETLADAELFHRNDVIAGTRTLRIADSWL